MKIMHTYIKKAKLVHTIATYPLFNLVTDQTLGLAELLLFGPMLFGS
jgi:hypothetical protein